MQVTLLTTTTEIHSQIKLTFHFTDVSHVSYAPDLLKYINNKCIAYVIVVNRSKL